MPGELEPVVATIPDPADLAIEAGSLLAAVMRAASDPNTDADKLEKLLAIGRELESDRAKARFDAAFSRMQQDLPELEKRGLVRNKSGRKQYGFLRYDDLHRAVKPILHKHQFATSFNFEEPGADRLTCILELSHGAGFSKFYRWTLPSMGENQYVSNLQNAAAARSFAKRCVLIDALDILAVDTDQDGSDQPPAQLITEDQARRLEDMLSACEQREPGATVRFHKWLKAEKEVEKIRQLFQGEQHDSATAALRRKMEALQIK